MELLQLTSLGFLFLVLILSIIYWILPGKLRDYFLLAISMFLITLYSPFHAGIIVILLIISFLCAKYINKTKKSTKRLFFLLLPVIITILNLVFFKYFGFFNEGLNLEKSIVAQIIPFLGVSYFTFRIIHFVVEVYWNKITEIRFSKYLQYVLFFPCFTAGPIHRYDNFAPQKPEFKIEQYGYGFGRVIVGLFKKLVIVDTIAVFTSGMGNGSLSGGMLWLALYLLSIQIYLDFSGYSDIAIGLSRMFGYKVMENFNWPYLKQNISLFWKNWHISLTSWIKDYVFIPLGGSRVVLWRVFFNTMVIMLLVGIWHGATFNFVVWGAIHGLALIVLRVYRMAFPLKKKEIPWFRKAWGAFITFNFVTFTWLFFFYDIETSVKILSSLFKF